MNETDIVITMDSDGEDQPQDLVRLLDALGHSATNPRKVVLARRTQRKESPLFKILYMAFKIVFRSLTGLVIRSGNFAIYRGWLTKNVLFHPHFDLCYSSSLISLNLDIEYVPCARGERYMGRSKMTYIKLITHGIRMLMPFIDRIAVRALVGFFAIFAFCFITAGFLVFLHLVTSFTLPSWIPFVFGALLMCCLILVGNFILLFTLFSQSNGFSLSGIDQRKW